MAAVPPYQPYDDKPPNLQWGMWKRFLLGSLVIVLATAGSVATAALMEVKSVVDTIEQFSPKIEGIEAPGVLDDVDAGGPQTIAIFGSDQRFIDIKQKNPVRSDTIILIRLDPSKGATAVMSLPRDLRVEIPGKGTDKINAAYALGGPTLSVRTIRNLLAPASPTGSFPINHVVNTRFGTFRRGVNRLGCVYVDVDRDYFNDNNPPFGGGPNYATIDVNSGYQLLCGQDSLDYVRYRHFDSDLVRAARQQDFLRQAKDQVGVSKFFNDRKELLRIFFTYTDTDIRSTDAVLRLLKLGVESARNPLQEVQFPAVPDGNDLTISQEALKRTVTRFLEAKGTPGGRGTERARSTGGKKSTKKAKRAAKKAGLAPGVLVAKTPNEDAATRLALKTTMPVAYPKAQLASSRYQADDSRTYKIKTRDGKQYPAFRMVYKTNQVGQNYGVQGTTWTAPPILDDPSETRTVAGRKLQLFFDGDRLRLIAWKRKGAVYWVSNTLLQQLTNRQMLSIAGSLSQIGSK